MKGKIFTTCLVMGMFCLQMADAQKQVPVKFIKN